MELRDVGQSPGQLADRWLVRKVLEEVSFYADLKAGDWQKAKEGKCPNGTGTGRSSGCGMPRNRSFGWSRGLDFQ